ncbi:MAG: CRISPR system precrRNA processing endoribonuclease RAMP protein Cas6 [Deltaproteobacteria bacterium]|nr:CRISPR system precrRNA processing endoribonuclease RAMP protein Cas6 [Deltaproteobacteria bacterium]
MKGYGECTVAGREDLPPTLGCRGLEASLGAFRCVRLRVEVKAQSTIHLPAYRGGALRGAFGTALKASCCVLKRQNCENCLLRTRCIYSYVFETPNGGVAEETRRYATAPHPFVLNLEIGGEEVCERGSLFSFGITLVGRAVEFLPYFVFAFRRMGELGLGKGRGNFTVTRLMALNGEDREVETVYTDGTLQMPRAALSLEDALAACERLPGDRLRMRLLTPLRLVYGGELCREPAFHVLVRNLLRRLGNLTLFHCDESAPALDGRLIDLAEEVRLARRNTRWHDWERYSHRQDKRMKLGGILGELDYEGDLAPFLPLLVLGSWVNLGKNTTFGLGRYRLEGV